MIQPLRTVIARFERQIEKLNEDRRSGRFSRLKVTVLGQQGLLMRSDSLANLNLLTTTDFDGLLKGEPPLEDIFKKLLRESGLSYDEKSDYIWLPPETKSEVLYESPYIIVDSPKPIFLIVSKAVKAPEKNRHLVIAAIEEFGDELIRLLEKHGADLDYFLGERDE